MSVSVALNVIVLDATAKGWLTVHSGGATPPGVASAQFVPGERIAHGLTVEPGADGSIDVRAFGGGCPHVLVDVLGHYAAPRVLEVQVGDQHTCVRSQGVTTQMRCWGGNLSGQLAYGPTAVSLPSPSTVAMGSAPLRIATGDDHTCAVLGAEGATAGNVWCSGANESGQLGDPTAWGREYHLRASTLTGAVDVAAGPSHTCAVVGADRRVRCVGANDRGQAPVEVEVPAPPAPERPWYCSFISCLDSSGLGPTPLTGVSRIAVGGSGSCAVLDSGRVRCWGLGVLGDAAFGQSSVAVEVPGITDAVDVSVGDDHACAAVLSGTTLRCWGRNDHGQLGQGGRVVGGAPVPVTVPGFSMVTGVSAGSARTCVEGFVPVPGGYDSRVACWGENSTGAVGDGTTTDRWSPVVVANGARSLRGVETGTSHTCVVADGRVECWGLNTSGQLGNGTRIDSPRPVVALD